MLRKDVIRSIERRGGTGDPQQIARFDALAEEWWKPDGKFKVVHGFNKARIDLIVDALGPLAADNEGITSPLAGLSVADVGCGVGIVSEPLARAGARVTGIDASAQNIEIARRHAEHSSLTIDYRCAVTEHLSAEHGKFDAVLCLEVVEHVADLQMFLASTAALVRPGGRLIIGTINRTARSWVLAIVAAERVLGWLPRGTHDWTRFVKPSETALQLGRLGLSQSAIHGIAFNPLAWRWLPSRKIEVNYLQVFDHTH
jgi:2-polyprenyl-6-hydroxyphenyl methylase/3-demethylubiquinone-9 3-methyltransferase